jgi:MFS family permease
VPYMKWLFVALCAMFFQQSFVTIGKVLPAILAPAIFDDLLINPSWLGVYVGIIAFVALTVQVGCGSFIIRYGSLRISQISLLSTGIGLALATPGFTSLMILSAVAIGASASSTPASSHLLGRYSPAQYAPLVFSIKQTAVPLGLLSAGLLGPFLTEAYDWKVALLAVAGACLVFTLTLETLRAKFDKDRDKSKKIHLSDFRGTVTLVLSKKPLRSLAFGCFAFVGLQTTFVAFFVIYLTDIDYSLIEAGAVFSIATAVAIPGRIFWGWLSSWLVQPRAMLGILALLMFVAAGLTSCFDASWSTWQVLLVAVLVSASVFSWHGVTLAEAARLAPSSMRGTVTGGVLSFGQFGGLVLPLFYSLILSLTGSYQLGFLACSLPALIVGVVLSIDNRKGFWLRRN